MSNKNHQREREVRIGEVIPHEGYDWVFEKTDLEQGGYYLCDPDLKKVAVIFPMDRSAPIDAPGKNARLLIRNFGSDDWYERGPYALHEAMTNGNKYAHRYRTRMIAHELLESMPNANRNRDNSQDSDGPKPASRSRSNRKRQRRRDRDKDRER